MSHKYICFYFVSHKGASVCNQGFNNLKHYIADKTEMQRFDPGLLEKSIHALELAAVPLQNDLAPLNRLKGGSPEAYFYWLKTNQLD